MRIGSIIHLRDISGRALISGTTSGGTLLLRRKMLLLLAGLVGLLVVASVGAIWSLQGVLSQLDHSGVDETAVHLAITRFRWVVLALALAFVVVINVSVMLLLRMGQLVLHPVEKLVEASRRLAREEFGYRVNVKAGDEFGELAAAFNHLAGQLQANESRKLETLAQAAVTLNHELNNAGAIITLQLQLVEKQNGQNPASERALRQIHESLARMTATVERLKHVRRIVLADYTADTKMLDLDKSVA